MPRGDQSGPEGEGPLTGRGLGSCAGNDMPGYAEPLPGRQGVGRRSAGRRFAGRGFAAQGFAGRRAAGPGPGGWRWRNWFRATGQPRWARFGPHAGPPDESTALKARAEWLRGELSTIDQRLGELDEQD